MLAPHLAGLRQGACPLFSSKIGREQPMRPKDFKRWRKSLGLSQKAAAETLGLKRRVVQYYEKGERDGKDVEIPKAVRLACFALSEGVSDYHGPREAPERTLEPQLRLVANGVEIAGDAAAAEDGEIRAQNGGKKSKRGKDKARDKDKSREKDKAKAKSRGTDSKPEKTVSPDER
jgi:transcriptional regulator with XRE-family HTH domain